MIKYVCFFTVFTFFFCSLYSETFAFDDIQKHWAKDDILSLHDRGIIHGYSDNEFKPDEKISRAEAAVILRRELNLPQYVHRYIDVPTNHWAYYDISSISYLGFLSGYNDKSFRPSKALTREELSSVLVRIYEFSKRGSANFPDVKTDSWSFEDIEILASNNVLRGYPDNEFKPQKAVSRAEFSSILNRVINNYSIYSIRDTIPFDYNMSEFYMVDYFKTDKKGSLFVSNSPEKIYKEGVYHKANVSGDFTTLIHHLNKMNEQLQPYLLVKNISNKQAIIKRQKIGFNKPTPYPLKAGKDMLNSYYSNHDTYEFFLSPNETKLLTPDVLYPFVSYNEVFSLMGQFHSNAEIELSFVMTHDIITEFDSLNFKPVYGDKSHVRGLFPFNKRIYTINKALGVTKERIVIGDGFIDLFLEGFDSIDSEKSINKGNYGLTYQFNFKDVSPHTTIALSARGGSYSGVVKVNDRLINISNKKSLPPGNYILPIYQSYSRNNTVKIELTPAPGSSLPVHILAFPSK